jgi:hypothetical protein
MSDETTDHTAAPGLKGPRLSDHALGRGDVEEMRETLEDIGAGYSGDERRNPFSTDGSTPDYPFDPKSDDTDDPNDGLDTPDSDTTEVAEAPETAEITNMTPEGLTEEKVAKIEKLLAELERLIEAWKTGAENDTDGHSITKKILFISGTLMTFGNAFRESEYYQKYKDIKSPYHEELDKSMKRQHEERRQSELRALRRKLDD